MMPNPEAYISSKEKAGDIVIGMTNLPSHFHMGQPHLRGYKRIRLALGMHPLLAAGNRGELLLFKQLVDHTSYIGEIGLDFSREGKGSELEQKQVFREILSVLRGKNKIISVHSRRAEEEMLIQLKEFDIKNVIFHWYSGSVELIPEILARGYYFSINEAMCQSNNGRSIIEKIPRERILTETDAPYNERSQIKEVLSCLKISENEVYNNFRTLLKGLE
jgi:TatD DNase family protein